MKKQSEMLILWMIMLGMFLCLPQFAVAKEIPQAWELIKPDGVIEVKDIAPAPRLSTLEGKTIVLRWNGKHNGDNFLDRIAELLKEKVPGASIIKLYEIDKSTNVISGSIGTSAMIAQKIKALKADIVIGSTCD